MTTTSTFKYARISAFKAREVTRCIQGLSAADALDLVNFTPKKAARLIQQTLKSAIANAENNHNARVDQLLVKEAVVGEGPTIKRFRARARGSASPIRKRTSHIKITLTDESAPVEKATKRRDLSPEARTKRNGRSIQPTPAPEQAEAPAAVETEEARLATEEVAAEETVVQAETAEPEVQAEEAAPESEETEKEKE